MKNLEEKARNYADKIWGTEGMTDVSDFNIPLSMAIAMMKDFTEETLEESGVDAF